MHVNKQVLDHVQKHADKSFQVLSLSMRIKIKLLQNVKNEYKYQEL